MFLIHIILDSFFESMMVGVFIKHEALATAVSEQTVKSDDHRHTLISIN